MSLNEKQKAFCEYYASSFNATESAKKAGYSEKTAYSIGCENLKKPEIQKYLAELSNKAKTNRIADITEILEFFSETMRNRSLQAKDRLKAAELLKEAIGESKEENQESEPIEVNLIFRDCSGGTKNAN